MSYLCLLYYKLLWYLPKPQREYGVLSTLPSLRALLTQTCPREMNARDADNIRKFSLEGRRLSTPHVVASRFTKSLSLSLVSCASKRPSKPGSTACHAIFGLGASRGKFTELAIFNRKSEFSSRFLELKRHVIPELKRPYLRNHKRCNAGTGTKL